MLNIEVEKAFEIIDNNIKKIEEVEIVTIENALNRIIAEDFYAPMSNPPFNKSPLDGYCLRSEDSKENNLFDVIDTVYAGGYSKKEIKKNQAIRIMTGAKLPDGADCVIRLEDTAIKDGKVYIDKILNKYENFCFKGEDIKEGELLIEKNTVLNAVHLGVLGSMGKSQIKVIRKPRIGLLVTGDEIEEYNEILAPGKIYDTNGILIGSRLKELDLEYIKLDKVEDDYNKVSKLIKDNIDSLDLLITTGGVSVGDKDIFGDVVDNLNAKKLFWRVKMKPGTPIMFSLIGDEEKPMISLSGNPFAALVNFEIFVRRILYHLYENSKFKMLTTSGIMKNEFNKKSKNIRYIRCIYDNGFVTIPENKHASGMLLSMKDCNGLIEIEKGNDGLKVNDKVKIHLI